MNLRHSDFLFIFFLFLLLSCQPKDKLAILSNFFTPPVEYRMVGDINADPKLDDPNFKVCGGDVNVAQYFHFGEGLDIAGEQPAIADAFYQNYKPVDSDQSGWIRIRFIVNCDGDTGLFRITGSDENYQQLEFDPAITAQLLEITKNLSGWATRENEYGPLNYYQYLIFVMEKGQIKEILP